VDVAVLRTVVFALVYVALYPALGRNPRGVRLDTVGEHTRKSRRVDAQVKPLFEKYLKMDLVAVAADKEAMEMGGRLLPDLLHAVPRRDGAGFARQGFPNLTDKDWQWGGAPAQIIETITNGRIGMMPPYGGSPEAIGGEAGAKEVANYVRSLSGLSHNSDLAEKGKARYETASVLPVTVRTARGCKRWVRRT
jgi:cytochrome c oxidase cbb3-type subunit III